VGYEGNIAKFTNLLTTGNVATENFNIPISIFPNPTINQFSIDTELKINKIFIMDISGKIIKAVAPGTKSIDVDELANGIYFIQFNTEEGNITKKLVKQ